MRGVMHSRGSLSLWWLQSHVSPLIELTRGAAVGGPTGRESMRDPLHLTGDPGLAECPREITGN